MRRKKVADNRVLVQMRLRPELAERLKARAREEALPMSAWIRQLIVFALNRPSKQQEAKKGEGDDTGQLSS